jgi:putative ABC transport system ATP-binding protein
MELLKRLNDQEGITIVLVTHDANLATQYARRTITMMDGTVQSESRS